MAAETITLTEIDNSGNGISSASSGHIFVNNWPGLCSMFQASGGNLIMLLVEDSGGTYTLNYRTSSNGGSTWSSATSVFTLSSGILPHAWDAWMDSSNNVYVAAFGGSTFVPPATVQIVKLSYSSGSWSAGSVTSLTSSNLSGFSASVAQDGMSLCVDSGGNVWLAFAPSAGTTVNYYYASSITGTWSHGSFSSYPSGPTAIEYISVRPIGSGNVMITIGAFNSGTNFSLFSAVGNTSSMGSLSTLVNGVSITNTQMFEYFAALGLPSGVGYAVVGNTVYTYSSGTWGSGVVYTYSSDAAGQPSLAYTNGQLVISYYDPSNQYGTNQSLGILQSGSWVTQDIDISSESGWWVVLCPFNNNSASSTTNSVNFSCLQPTGTSNFNYVWFGNATLPGGLTVTTQTINSQADIQALTSQTITGKANIISPKTIQSQADILATTDQLITSQALVQGLGQQFLNGQADIQATTDQTIQASALIYRITNQTVNSQADIAASKLATCIIALH